MVSAKLKDYETAKSKRSVDDMRGEGNTRRGSEKAS